MRENRKPVDECKINFQKKEKLNKFPYGKILTGTNYTIFTLLYQYIQHRKCNGMLFKRLCMNKGQSESSYQKHKFREFKNLKPHIDLNYER